MVVQGKVAKIVCILLGIIFSVMALSAVFKNLVAEKEEAQIVHIVDRFTTSRDIRAGNDGGRDSAVEYGIVAEIAIEGDETQKISITRRAEDNLPQEGELIRIKKGPEGKWFEYDGKLFSTGAVLLFTVGCLLIIIGIFGKVRE